MAASTGGQLFMTCKRYAAKEASWDDVMAAAKIHKPTYDNAEVSDDIYEDDNVYSLTDLKDFVFLPISSKEKKILRDYFNQ